MTFWNPAELEIPIAAVYSLKPHSNLPTSVSMLQCLQLTYKDCKIPQLEEKAHLYLWSIIKHPRVDLRSWVLHSQSQWPCTQGWVVLTIQEFKIFCQNGKCTVIWIFEKCVIFCIRTLRWFVFCRLRLLIFWDIFDMTLQRKIINCSEHTQETRKVF